VSSRLKSPGIDRLFATILQLKTTKERYLFFEDVYTVAELISLAQRLEVARKLDDGASYSEISAATGPSTATISRVKRCLNFGADGYRLVRDRLEARFV